MKWQYNEIGQLLVVVIYTIFNFPLFALQKNETLDTLIKLVIEELEQVAKLERAWNLALVLQSV